MRNRLALLVISLPAIFALVSAASFHLRNRNNGAIVSGGQRREYLLYVPRSYDASRPTPLVISLHGAGGWPAQQMALTGWNRVAERERFIVVYPSAIDGFGPRIWQPDSGPGLDADVRFIRDLIDKLSATYNIDRRRVYANGFSNGGGMSFALSCTLSDRIAAVGLVGAAQTLPWSWCTDHRAVPMLAIHGTADPVALYGGGKSWAAPQPFPSVVKWTAMWARRNRCAPTPVESRIACDVIRREYTGCADGATVALDTIESGGHTWPGGTPLPEWFVGRTTQSFDATDQLWTFFASRRLR